MDQLCWNKRCKKSSFKHAKPLFMYLFKTINSFIEPLDQIFISDVKPERVTCLIFAEKKVICLTLGEKVS